MWSIAIYDLSLTPEQFFALTPRQFDALAKRHERRMEHDEFMLAQLTSCLVNFSMCRPKESVTPKDFMPSQFGKPGPKQKKIRLTKARRKAVSDTLSAGMAALVARGKR
jgi:hypothetical protein